MSVDSYDFCLMIRSIGYGIIWEMTETQFNIKTKILPSDHAPVKIKFFFAVLTFSHVFRRSVIEKCNNYVYVLFV